MIVEVTMKIVLVMISMAVITAVIRVQLLPAAIENVRESIHARRPRQLYMTRPWPVRCSGATLPELCSRTKLRRSSIRTVVTGPGRETAVKINGSIAGSADSDGYIRPALAADLVAFDPALLRSDHLPKRSNRTGAYSQTGHTISGTYKYMYTQIHKIQNHKLILPWTDSGCE